MNHEAYDDQMEYIEAIVERLNRVYSDELTDETPDGEEVNFDLVLDIWNAPDHSYRMRVRPSDLEHGSWESDLGPAFKDLDELEAFLRGLEFGRDIDHKAEYID